MGIVERKEREKEEMRKLILEAAQKLFLETGFEKVSIRNIADAIEYSPATIYLYFKDKNELLYAIHNIGFQKMVEEFQPALNLADPFDRLVEMGRRYFRFAFENPELFDLMFIMTAPMDSLACRDDDKWDEGRTAFQLLITCVQDCIDAGVFKYQDAEVAALMIWSAVHGNTALFLRKRLEMFEESRRKQLMEDAFTLFIETIHKGL
ncbi:TetR/AcrR family transcriptional regulator [Larkinella humicola]|uniref:TetR/AcrR family transcriptional regulator n=1 Tax=Larkinella humicola TaxID=2607654 RepID=A0A5N1JGJ5_9BACT|nr:TetR/AcrR family transcriptional regulator [Larkinella humicola]KAA9353617.1 TetR/AcrR family transcriptional regulator [Larkinella humicola]